MARQITSGPDKSDVIFSLFDGKRVQFLIEDRSGGSKSSHHNVTIFGVNKNLNAEKDWLQMNFTSEKDGVDYSCSYNPITGKGHINGKMIR